MLKKLYTQIDFLNLTKEDIDNVKNILEIDIPEEVDEYQYLYENINIIEGNPDTERIISNKVLAGQVSVKWFKFDYTNEFTIEMLREKLESANLGFEVSASERLNLNLIDDVASIVQDGEIYTLKIIVNNGYIRLNNGIESIREQNSKGIIVNINIREQWVEIRANDKLCSKVVKILENKFGLVNLRGVRLLQNYNNDIDTFKNNLCDGFYLTSKAVPSQVVELTEEDMLAIGSIIESIDCFFEDKDGEKLVKTLNSIDYEADGLSLVTILLAGIDNVGMKIRNDSEKDMSKQVLHNLLKDNIIEDSSYIRFAIRPDGTLYTMRVGINTNSIVFKTSVTEEVIIYIRNKIL